MLKFGGIANRCAGDVIWHERGLDSAARGVQAMELTC